MKRLLAYLFLVLGFGLVVSVNSWAGLELVEKKTKYILDVNFCKPKQDKFDNIQRYSVVTLLPCKEYKGIGVGVYVKSNITDYKKNRLHKWKKFCLRKDSSKISKSLINKLMPTIFSCEILGEDYAQVEFDGEKFYTYEQTQTDDNSNVVQQIKDLKELYDSGALTEEEFNKAKKKLLN